MIKKIVTKKTIMNAVVASILPFLYTGSTLAKGRLIDPTKINTKNISTLNPLMYQENPLEGVGLQSSTVVDQSIVWEENRRYDNLTIEGDASGESGSENVVLTIKDANLDINPGGTFTSKNKSTLELDGGNFFGERGKFVIVSERNNSRYDTRIVLRNDSTAAFGLITGEQDKNAFVVFEANSSTFTMEGFDFSMTEAATVDRIVIKNTADNSNSHTASFTGFTDEATGRKIIFRGASMSMFSLDYAKVDVYGDILSTSNMVLNINDYSELNFKGDQNFKLESLATINVINNSKFIMPRGTIDYESRGTRIKIEENSLFKADQMRMQGLSFILLVDDSSEFDLNKLYTDLDENEELTQFNLQVTNNSKATIDTLDLRGKWRQDTEDVYFQIISDESSDIEIETIILDGDVDLKFVNVNNLKLKELRFDASNSLNLSSSSFKSTLRIGDLSYDAEAANSVMNSTIENINLRVDNTFDVDRVNNVNMNLINSSFTARNVNCDGCDTFQLYGDGKSSFTSDSFNTHTSQSNNETSIFSNIRFRVKDRFSHNGAIRIEEGANVSLNRYTGSIKDLDLENGKLTLTGERTSITATTPFEVGANGVLEILSTGDDFKGSFTNKDVKINNAGLTRIGGNYNRIDTVENTGVLDIFAKYKEITDKDREDNKDAGKFYTEIGVVNNGATATTKMGDYSRVLEFNNSGGELYIYGNAYIKNYVSTDANSQITLNIEDRKNYGNLTLEEMDGNLNSNLLINFGASHFLRPGKHNVFKVLKTRKGAIGYTDEEFQDALKYTPAWFRTTSWKEYNNGENADNGETGYIDVSREINFNELVKYSGKTIDDNTGQIVNYIDSIVESGNATQNLEEIIFSLDFGSGCTQENAKDLYEAHHGDKEALERVSGCLSTLHTNMEKLNPISNEIFLFSTHTNMINGMDLLFDENRSYNGLGDTHLWIRNTTNHATLDSEGSVAGYSGLSNTVLAGLTTSMYRGWNSSISVGLGISDYAGDQDRYDMGVNTGILSAAMSYVGTEYYASFGLSYGLTGFNTKRHVDFLIDSPTVVQGTNITHEVVAKTEVGTEFIFPGNLLDHTYFVPKITTSLSAIYSPEFEESHSPAAYRYDAFTSMIVDGGIGADLYKEFFISDRSRGGWFAKASIGGDLLYRYYQVPQTVARFADTGDKDILDLDSPDYTGIYTQGQVLFSLYKEQSQFEIDYKINVSAKGYMSHGVSLGYKKLI